MCVCSSVFAHEGGSRLVYLSPTVIKVVLGALHTRSFTFTYIYILITLHFIMMNPICKNVCTTRANYIIVAGVPE